MSKLYEKLLAEADAERANAKRRLAARGHNDRGALALDALVVELGGIDRLRLFEFAHVIRQDWPRPYFGAVPYIDALRAIDNLGSDYGADSGEEIVRYFLSNAATWRGPVARKVKAELKRRLAC